MTETPWTAGQLRARARLAWRNAQRVHDRQVAEMLKQLAREYEAEAAELDAASEINQRRAS
jgi:hypothetical protein